MTATWTEALAALAVPPGVPGSGRLRYGAAMTLWREGLIGPEVLEVYRIASPRDAEDPEPLLAGAGLALPGTEIAALAAAAGEVIATRSFPGHGAVVSGLSGARPEAPDPRPNQVVTAHLAAALAAMESASLDPGAKGPEGPASPPPPARSGTAGAPLAAAIRAAAPWLGWLTYDLYPLDEIGPAFAAGHAFAALAQGEDFELGLFLIAPGVFYRDRAHAAPELYLPLTGPHLWRFGPGTALAAKPALEPVWNPPHRPHATRTATTVPFLCLYVWTRDTGAPAYVLPAPDTAAIEAMP